MIRLSVALVTRNRPEFLYRCLVSLSEQSVQPFEVIVSDDSDPPQAVAAQKLAAEFTCRYLAGPRRGLYANRNHAARACHGTHVRTMDDDHTFPADHFAQCWAAIQLDPRAIWTTGEISFMHGTHYGGWPTATQLHPSGVGIAVTDPDNNWAIADGSTIYPSEIFDRRLWMVEDFTYGSSYLEFGAFLYRCGYVSRCIRGALVEHHVSEETIRRRYDRRMIPSQLFASLCFNLWFRPNLLRAWRYALSCLRRDPCNVALLRSVPRLVDKARERGAMAATFAAQSTVGSFPDHERKPCLPSPGAVGIPSHT